MEGLPNLVFRLQAFSYEVFSVSRPVSIRVRDTVSTANKGQYKEYNTGCYKGSIKADITLCFQGPYS